MERKYIVFNKAWKRNEGIVHVDGQKILKGYQFAL